MSALKAFPLPLPTPQRKSGRVVFDDSGRGTWEWQTSTGVFERFITDEQLLRLESRDLELVEEPQAKVFAWTGSHATYKASAQPRHEETGPVAKLLKRIVGKR